MDQNKQNTPNTNPQEKQGQNQQSDQNRKPVQAEADKKHDSKIESPAKQ